MRLTVAIILATQVALAVCHVVPGYPHPHPHGHKAPVVHSNKPLPQQQLKQQLLKPKLQQQQKLRSQFNFRRARQQQQLQQQLQQQHQQLRQQQVHLQPRSPKRQQLPAKNTKVVAKTQARQFRVAQRPQQRPLQYRRPVGAAAKATVGVKSSGSSSAAPRPGFSGFLSHVVNRFGKNFRLSSRYSRKNTAQSRKQVGGRPGNGRQRTNKFSRDPNAPNFFYMKAEDIPGYQKFTLDEVVFADDEEEILARSDDVKEKALEYVDAPKEDEKAKDAVANEDKLAEEETKEVKVKAAKEEKER